MITGILADEFKRFEAQIWPYLDGFAARDLDGSTAEGLARDILSRDRQMWAINDFQAFALTKVTSKAVRITHCAGERAEEWRDALDDEMRAWAQSMGKARVISLARPGWSKYAKSRGYREAHREMVLELNNGQ